MVTAAAALLMLGALADLPAAARGPDAPLRAPWSGLFGEPRVKPRRAAASVPLPKPRPADAPASGSEQPAAAPPAPAGAEKPAAQAAPALPQASACRLALTDAMAAAIADWVRTDLAELALSLGSEISGLDNFDSFECRGRNRVVGAMLSEHGRANALDVRAVRLANGQSISLTDRNVPRGLRESVLQSVCARFSTVLGPGSDWYHEDHIHLDLMERHNNYRICQWNVWDPLPLVAPLLPAERPAEAPPREVAATSGADRPEPDAAKSAASPPASADTARHKKSAGYCTALAPGLPLPCNAICEL